MNEGAEEAASLSAKQRRALRQRHDPHGLHPFKRLFLGPSPVPSSSAAAVAAAIAEDVGIAKPNAIAVAGKQGSVMVASHERRSSHDSNSILSQPNAAASMAHSWPREGAGSPVSTRISAKAPERTKSDISPVKKKRSNSFLQPLFRASSASSSTSASPPLHAHDRTTGSHASVSRPELSLLTIPRSGSPEKRRILQHHDGGSQASVERRRRPRGVSRDTSMASFSSAKSKPYPLQSEAEADEIEKDAQNASVSKSRTRSTSRPRPRAQERQVEAAGDASPTKVGGFSPPRKPLWSNERRNTSQSAHETSPQKTVQKKISFDVASGSKPRRGRSDGDRDPQLNMDDVDLSLSRPKTREELVNGEVTRVDNASSSPASGLLRGASSHPNMQGSQSRSQGGSMSSSSSSNFHIARAAQGGHRGMPRSGSWQARRSASLDRSRGKAYARSSVGAGAGVDKPPIENDNKEEEDLVEDHERYEPHVNHDRRVSILAQNNSTRASLDGKRRERAGQRPGMLGQGIPLGGSAARLSATRMHGHGRDMSKQSRMSRASTLGSIGTRFTEGSFGASGGVRSRLFSVFRRRSNGPTEARVRDIQLENIRHGKRLSAKGGVVAGAVGTSAGGTKWVGQTFEVGKRFWEVIESREEQLAEEERAKGHQFGPGDVVAEDDAEYDEETSEVAEEEKEEEGRPRDRQMTKSPSDVLSTFAREAKKATKSSGNEQSEQVEDRPSTPALVPNESDSDGSSPQRQTPSTPAPPHVTVNGDARGKTDMVKTGEVRRRQLQNEASAASLLTLPHHRGPEHESTFNIESRQGWTDVVSFITANSSFKGGDGERKDLGRLVERSKRAFDQGLEGIRASRSRKPTSDREDEAKINNLVNKVIRDASDSSIKNNDIKKEQSRTDATSMRPLQGIQPMSSREATQHPEAPLGIEDKLPVEETFELLRRRDSDPGCRPGADPTNDAASDTAVLAQRSESPVQMTKSNGAESIALTPLGGSGGLSKSVMMNGGAEGRSKLSKKKSVQFQDGDHLRIPLPGGSKSLSSSLFPRTSPLGESVSANGLLGGRLRGITTSGDAAPAPPEEVLSRDHTPDEPAQRKSPSKELQGYLGGADGVITRKSILKRDRMLVRTAWSPSEDLPKDFNEHEHRKYPLFLSDFREYLVVLRMGRLELWDDPSLTSKILGHKDRMTLEMTIPLRKGRTFASIYSAIDRVFCITFAKDADHRGLLELRKSGTHVLLFDARSQTIAADWMWELWRELGGTVPENLDVHIPIVDVRVRVPIPDEIVEGRSEGVLSLIPNAADPFLLGEGFKATNRRNLLHVITTLCHQIPQWDELARRIRDLGLHYELAWRNDINLTWVTYDRTTQGQPRDWAVLCGAIMPDHYKKPSVLEFRAALHYPTQVRMPKGKLLMEPPSVEGFLWRVKAVSGTLTRLYVTVHDGHIFFCRSARAFPPDRHLACATEDSAAALTTTAMPGLNDRGEAGSSAHGYHAHRRHPQQGSHRRVKDVLLGRKKRVITEESLDVLREQVMETVAAVASTQEEVDAQMEAYRAFERRRQFEQINNAEGYVDLRDILAVSSCGSGPTYRPGTDECEEETAKDPSPATTAQNSGTTTPLTNITPDEGEDLEDVGGEEGLAASKDRNALRRERQFEVTMSNQRSIRFEAYSRSVAREWLERLAALARYWKRREKVDALEIMNATGYDPNLIRKQLQERSGYRPLGVSPDAERIAPTLGAIWHWCTIQGCRGIVRCGRLFHKKKAYQPFRSRYYILIAGRLLCYKLMTSNRTSRSRQNSGIFHRKQETVVHLRDAYVYSGKLTEEMLLNGRSEGASGIGGSFGVGTSAADNSSRHLLPRVYPDGLLSVDGDMDCTFVIRYRPQRVNQPAEPLVLVNPAGDNVSHAQTEAISNSIEQTTEGANPSAVPALGDKTHMNLVLRARCKLERDLWVRAISIEIERLVREDREREERLRNVGETPYKAHQHYL